MSFGRLPRAGALSLAALAIELALLSLLFDLALLGQHDRPWAFLGRFGDAVPFLFVAAAVGFAMHVRGRSLTASVTGGEHALMPRTPRQHVAAFLLGGFALLGLIKASEGVLRSEPPSTLLFALWVAAGVL